MPSSTQPPLTEYSILSSYLLNPSPLPQILSFSDFVKTCVPQQHRDHPHVKRLYRDLQFQRDIDVDVVRQNIERECQKAGILRGRLAAKIAIENGNASSHREDPGKKRKRAPSTSEATTAHRGAGTRNQSTNQEALVDDEDEFNNTNEVQVSETIHQSSAHPATSSLPVGVAADKSKFVPNSTHHTTSSLLNTLERSIASLKREDDDLDAQSETLLREMQETVGQLSDLRYGRFARPASANENGAASESFEESVVEALQHLESAARRIIDK